MCSSLLGLGGTYVQQCFVCIFLYIYVPHFPVYSKAIQYGNMSLLSYMSSQHHVGLQPANLVTIYISVRRRDPSVCLSDCPSVI